MSFREKTAWISLVSTAGIYAFYFWSVLHAAPSNPDGYVDGLLGAIVALVVVQVVLVVAVRAMTPRKEMTPRDEREELIDLKATRVAYAGLASSVAFACFFGAFDPPIIFGTNSLLFLLVTAEILRSGCQIIQYRRGGQMGTIRNEIRRLRFEHGEMTQQQLAERIGVTRQTVNAIEQGKYSPSLEAAFRIAVVFGLPLEDVFHYYRD